MKHKISFIALLVFVVPILFPNHTYAQGNQELQDKVFELESRLRELEDFVTTLHTQVTEYTTDSQKSLKDYRDNLEESLSKYSADLYSNIEERVRFLDDSVAVLNLTSKNYERVVTNSGVFLISIQKVEKISNGVRLIFHIGNPNFASYQGLKLKINWGRKWDPNSTISYLAWKRSLVGGEFSYGGRLEQGAWTEVIVDISPVAVKQLQHIECSLDVESIQLNLKKPNPRR